MPASEMTVWPARRWMRRLIRCVLWTAILGFVLLAGLLWLLQQPMCKDWIQQRLSEQTEGEITFESVGLSWNCALKLNGVQYKIDPSGGTYTLSSQSLQLDDLLFGRPHLYLRNIGTQLGGEQVLSASRGVVAWPEPESGSPFALTFHQADIDFFPILRSLDEAPKAEPASAVVSPTMRIEVLNSKVRLPWKMSDILWNASIDLREGAHRASGLLHLSPVEGEAQNRLSLSLDVEPQNQNIHAAHLHAEQFPFTLYDPVLVDVKFDGDIRIEPLESVGYQTSGNFIAGKTVYESSGVVSVVAESASSTFSAIVSPTYALESIQATIHHSPVAIDLATSGLLPLPTGDAVISVTRANSPDPFTKFDWRSNEIGSIAITSRAWPPSSTGRYAIDFSVPSKSIDAIRGFLPKWAEEWASDVSGMLALSGNIGIASQSLAEINMRAVLKDGRYEIAGAELNSLNLSGPIKMDAAKLTAKATGTGHLRYPLSATQVIELDLAPKEMNVALNRKTNAWDFETPTFDARPLHDLTFRVATGGEWAASAKTEIEELLPALLPVLVPDVTRTIEGIGGLVVSVSGDSQQVSVHATSPDLALFSFDQEPAFGLQLRDVDFRFQWRQNAQDGESSCRIRAATPYFSYKGNDIEWPSKEIILEWGKPSASWDKWVARLFPPGGGLARLDYQKNSAIHILAGSLSVNEFIMPLINQFVMEEGDKEKPFVQASGVLNGEWLCESLFPLDLSGLLKLSQFDLVLDSNPAIVINNASISAPMAYPIAFDSLPRHEISFQAAQTRVDDATFQQVDVVIPFTPDRIPLLNSLVFPLYGGRTALSNFQIHDWQTKTPLVSGGIQFEDLSLERVAKAFPILPARGKLSGQLNSIRVSSETLEATGELVAQLFGGSMTMKDFSLTRPMLSAPLWKMDVAFHKLDLEKITEYFDYGKMTGQISGSIDNFEMMLPEQEGDWPYPRRFDITIRDDMKGMGMASKTTLQKIINLGESSGLKKLVADRDVYLFSKLGLKATLDGNDLRLYGTLKDNLFLETDEINVAMRRLFNPGEWFAIPVNINLANPEDVIPFDRVWERLMSQIEGKSP